jgi:hypothetical protein
MATAMAFPEGLQGRGKNKEAKKATVSVGFSAQYLRMARLVLKVLPEDAELVLKGALALL